MKCKQCQIELISNTCATMQTCIMVTILNWMWSHKPNTYEPGHEKMSFMPYEKNKGADQLAHPRSLISARVVRCLDSIISLDSIAKISRLYLASVAAQAGLCLAWSETPDDTFSHGVAHIFRA